MGKEEKPAGEVGVTDAGDEAAGAGDVRLAPSPAHLQIPRVHWRQSIWFS